jgi:hypothetical protein
MRCAAAKEVRTGEKSVIEGGIQRWLNVCLRRTELKPLAFLVI